MPQQLRNDVLVRMANGEREQLEAITNALARLAERQQQTEKRLAELEAAVLPRSRQTPVQPPPRVSPPPQPSIEPSRPVQPAPAPAPAVAPVAARTGLETKFGLTLVNRVGVITLVLGVAFFFKWAVDNNWIGETGRVVLGVLAGLAVLVAGDVLWRKGQQVFAQGITGTGIAVLYLSLYSAYGFYHLILQWFAFLLLTLVTALALGLSLRYASQAITSLGFLGGYLIPLLLGNGEDHPWFLFSYLLLLDGVAVWLSSKENWRAPELLSFCATAILYAGWFSSPHRSEEKLAETLALLAFYGLYWRSSLQPIFLIAEFLSQAALGAILVNHPEVFFPLAILLALVGFAYAEAKRLPLALTLAFVSFWEGYEIWSNSSVTRVGPAWVGLSAAFLIFFAWNAWKVLQSPEAVSLQRLLVLSVNGIAYYGFAYDLLNGPHHNYLAALAIAVAAVYAAFTIRVYRRFSLAGLDTRPALLSAGMSLAFVTVAIPIQFTGLTITIAWSLEAAALSWIASRVKSEWGFALPALIFALVAFRLLAIDSWTYANAASYSAIANLRFFTFVVAGLSFLLSAWWISGSSRPLALIEYFAGHVVLLWGLCLEISGWAQRSTVPENVLSVETVTISILFGVYAVLLVSAGVWTRTAINRIAGLILMAIVIAKLYLFDVWQLGRVYRISAFVVLGMLLISTSFLYSRFRGIVESWWKDDRAHS